MDEEREEYRRLERVEVGRICGCKSCICCDELARHTAMSKKVEAERYLTAERMVERYKDSTYTARQRARDHAISYPTTAWQWDYWSDVANIIAELERDKCHGGAKR